MSACGQPIHLGRGTYRCALEAGHTAGDCSAGPNPQPYEEEAMAEENSVDCRTCKHVTDVKEGVSVRCDLRGAEIDIRWEGATTWPCGSHETADASMPAELVTAPGAKDTNPKDTIGVTKLPLGIVPATALAEESLAFLNGALKYGKSNWRNCGVRASIYLDAAARHIRAWEDGEEVDAEGVPHLGSARACLGIIIDSRACGKLNDDRPPSVGLQRFISNLTPTVAALTKLHADKTPRHFTIADTER